MSPAPPPPPRPVYTDAPGSGRPRAEGSRMPEGWLRSAPVSRAILFVNLGIFALELALASRRFLGTFQIPDHESLLFGANYGFATLREMRFETLVTCCFLHGGLLHVGFNMWVLWQAGPLVERAVGSERMAPMYLVSGIVASAASALHFALRGIDTYSVGASGAIMGVLASALVLVWRARGFRDPVTQSLLRWLAFNLVFGFLVASMNIDNAAHLGGAVAGGVIALSWRRGVRATPGVRAAVLSACAAVVVVAFALVAWRDVHDPFAALREPERVEVAQQALADGRCRDARAAIAAATRLRPDDPAAGTVRSEVEMTCE